MLIRGIKKLILDGTEDWVYESNGHRFSIIASDIKYEGVRLTPLYCTHYTVIDDGRALANVPNESIYVGYKTISGEDIPAIYIKTEQYSSTSTWQTYLANQYANGTPVTIWYVLATPIPQSTTTSAIPTTSGLNTIDVATTLKPSEMSLTYDGYKLCKGQKYVNNSWV